MSRIAKNPIQVVSGISVAISGQTVDIKGPKGDLNITVHEDVEVKQEENVLHIAPRNGSKPADAMAGTTRALLSNMVTGVHSGFERKLKLVGVGYRAQTQGKNLSLTLGFSHPVDYEVPDGITVETPSQTEIVVTGVDKQKVGQVAADIRSYRPPEPYKGKGVRYSDETIVLKEAKKK